MKTSKQPFEFAMTNAKGKIYGTIYDVSPSIGVIILVHDVFEHRFQYEPIIEALNAEQFTVVTYNLRGHHLSLENGLVGHFDREGLVSDLRQVISKAQLDYPNSPLILMGGKISGWLINQVLSDVAIDKVILVGPMETPKLLPIKRWVLRLLPKRSQSTIGQKLIFKQTEFDTSDPFVGRELTNEGYVAVCDLFLSEPIHVLNPLSILLIGNYEDERALIEMKVYYQKSGCYDCQIAIGEKLSLTKIIEFANS